MAWYREENGVIISDEQFKEVCCNCHGHCEEGCISVPCRGDSLSCPYYDFADTDKYEKEIRAKALTEFAEVLKEKLRKKQKQTWLVLAERNGYARSIDLIDEISTELKGE